MTHEGALIASDSCTKDCSSGTSASKNPTEVTNVKFDSVSDFNTESRIDHDEKQSSCYVTAMLKLVLYRQGMFFCVYFSILQLVSNSY